MNTTLASLSLKAVRAFQDNGPDYWLVTTGKWRAPAVAKCNTEEEAKRVARAVNCHEELVKVLEAAALPGGLSEYEFNQWLPKARAALARAKEDHS